MFADINHKLPVILCDYRDTCNDKKHNPLLQKLSEYKKEGASIFLATNGDQHDAAYSLKNIKNRDFDVFDGAIGRDMFGIKEDVAYWQKLTQEMRYSAYDIIFIEDETGNLENAKANGVKIIDSKKPMEVILKDLDLHYRRLEMKLKK